MIMGNLRVYRHKIIFTFPSQAVSYLLLTRKNICDRLTGSLLFNETTITDKIIGTFTKLHHLDKNRDSYKHLPSPTPLNNVAKQCWTICQHCQGWSKEGELCVDRSLEI